LPPPPRLGVVAGENARRRRDWRGRRQLLKAPRNLKEPVRCSISGFKKTFVPARSSSTGKDNSGVRTANGATTLAAASISAALTGRLSLVSVMRVLYRAARIAGKPD
jgi:hypothetical protein